MSDNQFTNALVNSVRQLIDSAQSGSLYQQFPTVYRFILDNLTNPMSQLHQSAVGYIDQSRPGWRATGITPADFMFVLKPWTEQVVNQILSQQPRQPPVGYQPHVGWGQAAPPPYPNPQNAGAATGTLWDSPVAAAQPTAPPIIPAFSSASPSQAAPLDSGKDIMFNLRQTSTGDFDLKPNAMVQLISYYTADYERQRMNSTAITLLTAENTALDAAVLAFDQAPQEAVRGIYANLVHYHELWHVPADTAIFRKIRDMMGGLYFKTKDWAEAIRVLEVDYSRSEWMMMNKLLVALFNQEIYRRFRADDGALIEGIDELGHLHLLADKRSTLTLTHHANYWPTLNAVIERVFDMVLRPAHLVERDTHFGDFIHCDGVVAFKDGHSKYDYGALTAIDRDEFCSEMVASNTVLRIPRTLLFTNAIDPRLVQQVQRQSPKQMFFIDSIKNPGLTLLEKLDLEAQRVEIDAVVCFEKGATTKPMLKQLNLGTTLDRRMILLPPT